MRHILLFISLFCIGFSTSLFARVEGSDLVPPKYVGAIAEFNTIKVNWYAPNETASFRNPEGFEHGCFPPAGWEVKVSDNVGTVPVDLAAGKTTWKLNTASAYVHSGIGSAQISYSKKKSNWLITPEFNLEANKQLAFYIHFTNDNEKSLFNVMLKEKTAANWISVLELNASSPTNQFDRAVVVDLKKYAGKEIQLAFVQSFTNGNHIRIDDISIEDFGTQHEAGKRHLPVDLQNELFNLIENSRHTVEEEVVYVKASNVKTTKLPTAYNLFVDGVKVKELTADKREYVVENLSKGQHKITMSAVYADGESTKSNEVTVNTVPAVVEVKVSKYSAAKDEELTFDFDIRGSYKSIKWNFGADATPAESSEKTVKVSYSSFGDKTISLMVNGEKVFEKEAFIKIKPGVDGVFIPQEVKASVISDDVTLKWPSLRQNTSYLEGFEDAAMASEWQIMTSETIDGEKKDPVGDSWFQCKPHSFDNYGLQYIHEGGNSAAIARNVEGFNWLISPELNVGNGEELRFWIWYHNGIYQGNYLFTNFKLMIKESGTWTELLNYTTGTTPNRYDKEVAVDLSKYEGKKVQLGFVYEGTKAFQMALDNIRIVNLNSDVLVNDFTKFNIYRDKNLVAELTDPTATTWVDEKLNTGRYQYYMTYVNKAGKESYPCKSMFLNAYKPLDVPFSEDFENLNTYWVYNEGSRALKRGTQGMFNTPLFAFPDKDDIFIAVNTADIYGYSNSLPEASDILPMSPFNLGKYGKATLTFDLFSNMPGFSIIGRENTNSKWKIIKQFPMNKNWEKIELELPLECLKDEYQLGLYYSNLNYPSRGIGIDNIKLNVVAGKHMDVTYNSTSVKNGDEVYLGQVKPGKTGEYTVYLSNYGSEDFNITSINLTGDKFAIKSQPTDKVLSPKEVQEVVITYTSEDLTSVADQGSLRIESDSEEGNVEFSLKAECGKAEWTYMVYLYEDGTGLNGSKDFNELEVLGSIQGKVNYIILYDSDNNLMDGVYYVQKDADGMNNKIISQRVSTEFNEGLNMDNPETLKRFILWGKEKYPARKYGCNVWDHGTGIFKSTNNTWKSACGKMPLWGVANSLKAFKEVDGKGFDIFGFDVCLLGQVETIHAIKDYTDVVIASEKTEPGDGWHYTTQFQVLNEDPNIAVNELARNIVLKYDASYDNGVQGNQATTQTAVRTDYFKSDFIPAFNAFAGGMLPEMINNQAQVNSARKNAWYSDPDDNRFVDHKDFGHFLNLLKAQNGVSKTTIANIDNLLAAYKKCIIETAENQRPNATGLKIWIPEHISKESNKRYYLNAEDYLNISETLWDEFLTVLDEPVKASKPTANFEHKGLLEGKQGMKVTFSDVSKCIPVADTREWIFEPSTVKILDGKTNSDGVITVEFLEAGEYSVSLHLKNSEGEDTHKKEKLITVNALVFPEPTNLSATVSGDVVNLTWESRITESKKSTKSNKIFVDFENGKLPEGWGIAYSKTIDGEKSAPTSKHRWGIIDKSSDSEGKLDKYIRSGKKAAYISYSAPEFNWLISEEFTVEDYDKLNFWIWYNEGKSETTGQEDIYYTNFRVMILADDAWNTELHYYKNEANINKYDSAVEIDLEKYKGKKIRFAFVYEFTDGFQLALDDIKVYRDAPIGTPDGEFSKYNIYRNNVKIGETKELSYSDSPIDDAKYVYHVTSVYTNADGESVPSNKLTIVNKTVGVEALTFNNTQVYPNPNTGAFYLKTEKAIGSNWALYNLSGVLVNSGRIVDAITPISVAGKGIYLMKINSDETSKVIRVVVK